MDTRSSAPSSGFVILLRSRPQPASGQAGALLPVVSLVSPLEERSAGIPVPLDGQWHYLGVNVSQVRREIAFHVDGASQTVPLGAAHPLRGTTAHLGNKRPANSQLTGFAGEMRFLAVYAGGELASGAHDWLHNRLAKELSHSLQPSALAPSLPPLVWLDPGEDTTFNQNFILPPAGNHGGSEPDTLNGRPVLRLRDQASAGVDLDENHRALGDEISIRFRFRMENGATATLCTVGDCNQPARLVVRDAQILLRAGRDERVCGLVNPGDWTEVSLQTARDWTEARVGQGAAQQVRHQPAATWVYLGDGFPSQGPYPGTRWLLDLPSLRSRVDRSH